MGGDKTGLGSFRPLLLPLLLCSVLLCCCTSSDAKVLELSDRFLPLRKEGMWLVKFYAPWCGHCKKLEPVFKHVGQSLAQENIRVGRIDCTRFTSVAHEFGIRGYPTIMFLKGDNIYTYEGDRTRDDIVAFSRRLLGPPVSELASEKELRDAAEQNEINFVFVGSPRGQLWNKFNHVASAYQQHEFFYQVPSHVAETVTKEKEDQVVRVFKDGSSYKYEDPDEPEPSREARDSGDQPPPSPAREETESQHLPPPPSPAEEDEDSTTTASPPPSSADPTEPTTVLNSSLSLWVRRERFPLFAKVTRGRFSHVLSTRKLVALAVLEENKIGELTPEMEEFRDMLRHVAATAGDKYRDRFQFGWTGSPDLANSVAMETLPLPSLIVVNSSTYQHHLPDDDPTQLTAEAIKIFLDDILEGSAPVYGGSSYTVRLYRAYYEARSNLQAMWRGNPALTAVLFGLPMGFFALICYSICCADIMDAEDEDEDGEPTQHEKVD